MTHLNDNNISDVQSLGMRIIAMKLVSYFHIIGIKLYGKGTKNRKLLNKKITWSIPVLAMVVLVQLVELRRSWTVGL